MEIRLGVVGEVEAVVALERGVATAPHWPEAEYRGVLRQGEVRRCLYVGVAAGEVVGFGVGRVVAGEGEVESLVVREGERRRGLGSGLCRAVLGWCRDQGAAAVNLEVRAGSAGALRMYGRLGFVEVGRRGGYYAEPVEDAVLMRVKM